MVNQDNLIKELQSISADYKASVIAAEIADNGMPLENIYFKNVSTFARFVSKDINKVSWNTDENESDQLVFDLNREGIYDMIPEGITHSSDHKTTEKEAIEEFALHRKQETAARNFFSTFENEFHQWSLQLEVIERELVNNKNERKNRTTFEYYFGSSRHLNDIQVSTLLYILPLSNKIRGNVKLLSETLTKVMNYKIVVTRRTGSRKLGGANLPSASLNGAYLGIDSILSASCNVCTFYYDLTIHNIPANEYKDFMPNRKNSNVLSFMLPYFFPAEADVNIVLLCKNDGAFALSLEEKESYLGFNSFI